MGAHNFETTIYTSKTVDAAYQEAVDLALYENGHEPYNGTISTTEGVALSPLANGDGTPTPEDQIDWRAINKRLDHLNKWEHCEALPIAKVIDPRTEYRGSLTAEVRVNSDLLTNGTLRELEAALEAALTRHLRRCIRVDQQISLDPDYRGQATVLHATDPGAYTATHWGHQIAQEPKATTRATKGKTETRYFVLPAGATQMPAWDTGHPSQAAARAALPTTLPSSRGWDQSPRAEYEVISMTRRVNGDPLVTHTLDAATGKTTAVNVRGHVHESTLR